MIRTEIDELFDLSRSVDSITAELQTRTCEKILNMLGEVPGIILGDDVGMGKTYIAFSTAVWFLSKYPKKKVVIITPNWLLNDKWFNDIRNFIEQNLNSNSFKLIKSDIAQIYQYEHGTYIGQIRTAAKKSKVILIPIDVFSSIGWKKEKSFFLACWFKHRHFWVITREEILSALGGDTEVYAPEDLGNMGIEYSDIPEDWYNALDDAYSNKGLSDEGIRMIWDEIKKLRYHVVNMVMPKASLLILDEAHKMKNEETVKRKALEAATNGNFDKGIFLTATPFQLGEGELKSVLNIFKNCTEGIDDIKQFDKLIDKLFLEMGKYQEYMRNFENFVNLMSEDEELLLETAIKDSKEENLPLMLRKH